MGRNAACDLGDVFGVWCRISRWRDPGRPHQALARPEQPALPQVPTLLELGYKNLELNG